MHTTIALQRLNEWDQQKRYVFALKDLSKIFLEDNFKSLQAGLNRLIKLGALLRPSRGVYVFNWAHSRDAYTLEHIAKTLRRGEYNYVSLESALSEYGVISQIPIDRLTVITTGRKGIYTTPFGTIEFTHTKRKSADFLDGLKEVGRPLRLASKATAWRDLKRAGRNLDMVNQQELEDGQ